MEHTVKMLALMETWVTQQQPSNPGFLLTFTVYNFPQARKGVERYMTEMK